MATSCSSCGPVYRAVIALLAFILAVGQLTFGMIYYTRCSGLMTPTSVTSSFPVAYQNDDHLSLCLSVSGLVGLIFVASLCTQLLINRQSGETHTCTSLILLITDVLCCLFLFGWYVAAATVFAPANAEEGNEHNGPVESGGFCGGVQDTFAYWLRQSVMVMALLAANSVIAAPGSQKRTFAGPWTCQCTRPQEKKAADCKYSHV